MMALCFWSQKHSENVARTSVLFLTRLWRVFLCLLLLPRNINGRIGELFGRRCCNYKWAHTIECWFWGVDLSDFTALPFVYLPLT